jgi:two-component system, NarL family, response regulator DegU
MNNITILIIDEQALFRAGVRQVLAKEPDINILDCSPSHDTLNLIESTMPDVILLGCQFSVHSNLSLAEQITRQFPGSKVIVLTPNPDDEELFAVIKSSAVACINKSASVDVLVDTIKKASAGEYPINDIAMTRPKVASQVLRRFEEMVSGVNNALPTAVYAPLTQREMHILSYIAEGNTNKQIARSLNISEQTIKNHISSILRKLNANDRAHAVTMAIRNNWISVKPYSMNRV